MWSVTVKILSLFDNASLLLLQLVWVLNPMIGRRSFIWHGVPSSHTNCAPPTPVTRPILNWVVHLPPRVLTHTLSHIRAPDYIWWGYSINTTYPHRVVMNCFCQCCGTVNTILQLKAPLPGCNGCYALMASLYFSILSRCISTLVVEINTLSFYELLKIVTSECYIIFH